MVQLVHGMMVAHATVEAAADRHPDSDAGEADRGVRLPRLHAVAAAAATHPPYAGDAKR